MGDPARMGFWLRPRAIDRVAALALCLVAGPVAAEPPPRDEIERWVPSIALFGAAVFQGVDAAVMSGLVTGDQAPPGPTIECPPSEDKTNLIRCPASGSDTNVGANVGGSLGIMTPGWTAIPGKPRLFLRGDAAGYWGFERDVAKDSVPGPFTVPDSGSFFLTEDVIQGQGSATSVETDPLMISAGLGVAFSVDLGERRLRIKPSVEYLREKLKVTGVVHRAVQVNVVDTLTLDDFRFIDLNASEEPVYHGLGPGLELELDAARAGPMMLSVFMFGQAFRFLGDLDISFSASQAPPCTPPSAGGSCNPPVAPETATWTFEKNPWAFRAGVGLRFHWMPE